MTSPGDTQQSLDVSSYLLQTGDNFSVIFLLSLNWIKCNYLILYWQVNFFFFLISLGFLAIFLTRFWGDLSCCLNNNSFHWLRKTNCNWWYSAKDFRRNCLHFSLVVLPHKLFDLFWALEASLLTNSTYSWYRSSLFRYNYGVRTCPPDVPPSSCLLWIFLVLDRAGVSCISEPRAAQSEMNR